MTGPVPAVARIRVAVRAELEDIPEGSLVLAAVSGGRDSIALAAALAFVAPRSNLRAGAVVVNHGLQPESATIADNVCLALTALGLDPVEVAAVTIDDTANLEAVARAARYDALDESAQRLGAAAVLLGHTRDDQAETVLLGLARGSGARSLSGMPRRRNVYRRPMLGIDRETTGAACGAAGLTPWDDPHNALDRFQRVKVRQTVLPVLEQELGPGVTQALARTADLLRDDDDALEAWAVQAAAECELAPTEPGALTWDCGALAALPAAVRRRIIRAGVLTTGVVAGSLRYSQLAAVDALVVSWQGQGLVDLPGGVVAKRDCGRLSVVLGGPRAPTSAARDDGQE